MSVPDPKSSVAGCRTKAQTWRYRLISCDREALWLATCDIFHEALRFVILNM
jgi:hypothetical protein